VGFVPIIVFVECSLVDAEGRVANQQVHRLGIQMLPGSLHAVFVPEHHLSSYREMIVKRAKELDLKITLKFREG
jgi:hypothetical protein